MNGWVDACLSFILFCFYSYLILFVCLLSKCILLCSSSHCQYIKDFYNKTVVRRNGTGLSEETLTLMYSLTVSVFAVGGLLGSLIVGMLVTRYGR